MIVYSYRHHLLGIFLANHIFIQSCFDLMGCRNIFQIKCRFAGFFLFLYFFRLLHRIVKITQIDHAHSRHVQQIGIIHLPIAHLLIHRIKALLHTIRTNMYIIGKVDHLPCLAFRSAAKKTVFLILGIVFFLHVFLFQLFSAVKLVCHIDSFLFSVIIAQYF